MINRLWLAIPILAGALLSNDSNAQAASKLTVLTRFSGGPSGSGGSTSDLIFDGAGNLYGTTVGYGTTTDGTVFKLSPPARGTKAWTRTVLHTFVGRDGAHPNAGVVMDAKGNLYGTTRAGGAHNFGTAFKLTAPAPGKTAWKETVLHSFNGKDGKTPYADLTFGPDGDIYGTTYQGGAFEKGAVFKLLRPKSASSAWTETVLHSFDGKDGKGPGGGRLIFDVAGNLYGTTSSGATDNSGTVFELVHPAKGKNAWTEVTLHRFMVLDDASNPYGGLTFDKRGDLYGTTVNGNQNHMGAVFKLTQPTKSNVNWTLTVLHRFVKATGCNPQAGVVFDRSGNLYGSTRSGALGSGMAFKLNHPAAGKAVWTETTLLKFSGADGVESVGNLILDKAGNVYGTTFAAGPTNEGLVFKLAS